MPKYNVMVTPESEIEKQAQDPAYQPVPEVHATLEFVNEMVAVARHREGIWDKKYPKGSWIEPHQEK